MTSVVAVRPLASAPTSNTSGVSSLSISSWKELSDAELIAKYKDGSDYALSIVIVRYYSVVKKFLISKARDLDKAEEFTQEAFISVADSIRTGKYSEKGSFKSWLMTIANNKFKDSAKAVKNRLFVATDFDDAANAKLSNACDVPVEVVREREDRLDLLEQKAKDLPDNLRSVFLLRMQDVKFCDISKQLNISINTATSRYQYAVRHLREMCASVM